MKINTYNDNGQRHGYWKEDHISGNVCFDGNYINGNEIGYAITYKWSTGYILLKQYFII